MSLDFITSIKGRIGIIMCATTVRHYLAMTKPKRGLNPRVPTHTIGEVCKDGHLAATYNLVTCLNAFKHRSSTNNLRLSIVLQYDTIDHQDPAGLVDGRYWFQHQVHPYRD
jgi:hypothetical protein